MHSTYQGKGNTGGAGIIYTHTSNVQGGVRGPPQRHCSVCARCTQETRSPYLAGVACGCGTDLHYWPWVARHNVRPTARLRCNKKAYPNMRVCPTGIQLGRAKVCILPARYLDTLQLLLRGTAAPTGSRAQCLRSLCFGTCSQRRIPCGCKTCLCL